MFWGIIYIWKKNHYVLKQNRPYLHKFLVLLCAIPREKYVKNNKFKMLHLYKDSLLNDVIKPFDSQAPPPQPHGSIAVCIALFSHPISIKASPTVFSLNIHKYVQLYKQNRLKMRFHVDTRERATRFNTEPPLQNKSLVYTLHSWFSLC